MYFLTINETFSAAHALRGYDGECSRTHGHNWQVKVGFKANQVDRNGFAIDYFDLKKVVDEVIAELDHQLINDHPYFKSVNPTSENISEFIYNHIKKNCPDSIDLDYVQIGETENFSVTYKTV